MRLKEPQHAHYVTFIRGNLHFFPLNAACVIKFKAHLLLYSFIRSFILSSNSRDQNDGNPCTYKDSKQVDSKTYNIACQMGEIKQEGKWKGDGVQLK